MLPTSHYNPRHKPSRGLGSWSSLLMSKWTISAVVIIVYLVTCLRYSNAIHTAEIEIGRLNQLSEQSKNELQLKLEDLEKRDNLYRSTYKLMEDTKQKVAILEKQLRDQLTQFDAEKRALQVANGRLNEQTEDAADAHLEEKVQLQKLNAQLEKSLATSLESFRSLQVSFNATRHSVDVCRDNLKTKVGTFEATVASLRNQVAEHAATLESLREQLVQCKAGHTQQTPPPLPTPPPIVIDDNTDDDATIVVVAPDNIITKTDATYATPHATMATPPPTPTPGTIDVGVAPIDGAAAGEPHEMTNDGHVRHIDNTQTRLHMQPFDATKETAAILAEFKSDTSAEARRYWIKREFRHAWKGYTTYAWGEDELKPISKTGHENFGMGLTLVDSLDTIIIMGLEEEYQACLTWIRDSLHFGDQEGINVFEVTIRILGGLLAAYNLKNEQLFLDRAVDLADQMLFAFDSPTGLPYGTIGLKTKNKFNPSWSGGASTVAEVGSIQMEWQYLSRVTGNPVYAQKVDHITNRLKDLNKSLYSLFISVEKGHMTSSVITFGARVDSLYEYFLKQHILSGKQKPDALKLYTDSMAAMINQLLLKSTPTGYTFVSELHDDKNVGKMDHLVCFVPGMLALGANHSVIDEPTRSHHMIFAKELMRTCYEFYRQTATGLSPEIVQFTSDPLKDFEVDAHATHSLLRPETVESLFVLWRTTHDPIYREWGWKIFEAFVHYCRIPGGGYSGIRDVRKNDITENWSNWSDKMESFWLAETLKYLYLLFEDDNVISLHEFVFNTEAHPLPIAQHR